jgi:O-antigen/teichoic acid export membrane protein
MIKVLPSEDIVLYSIFSKVFSTIHFIYAAALQALWPTLCEMLTAQRFKEVEKIMRNTAIVGGGFLLIATIAVMSFSGAFLQFFAPHLTVSISLWTMGMFSFYYLLRIISDTYATMLMSASKLSIFLVLVPFQALISGMGQYYFSTRFGLDGILYGLILSFICTVLWGLPMAYHAQVKRSLQKKIS